MPELITHYAVSLLISSRVVGLKYASLIALIGLLPDLDALFRIHRWFTHSIIVTSLTFLIVYVMTSKLKPKSSRLVITAYVVYATHIILDTFTASTPLLWPVTPISYMLKVGVDGVISVNGIAITQNVELNMTPADFTQKPLIEGPIISEAGLTSIVAVTTTMIVERLMRRRTC